MAGWIRSRPENGGIGIVGSSWPGSLIPTFDAPSVCYLPMYYLQQFGALPGNTGPFHSGPPYLGYLTSNGAWMATADQDVAANPYYGTLLPYAVLPRSVPRSGPLCPHPRNLMRMATSARRLAASRCWPTVRPRRCYIPRSVRSILCCRSVSPGRGPPRALSQWVPGDAVRQDAGSAAPRSICHRRGAERALAALNQDGSVNTRREPRRPRLHRIDLRHWSRSHDPATAGWSCSGGAGEHAGSTRYKCS